MITFSDKNDFPGSYVYQGRNMSNSAKSGRAIITLVCVHVSFTVVSDVGLYPVYIHFQSLWVHWESNVTTFLVCLDNNSILLNIYLKV